MQCFSRVENGFELLQDPPSIHANLAEFPELRVSTITPASVRLLKASVDWQDVAPPKSAAFTTMQVPRPLKSSFKSQEHACEVVYGAFSRISCF